MGRHDSFAHFMHLPKQLVLNQSKPETHFLQQTSSPQAPLAKTNANNRYLGRGRGR